MDLSDTHNPYDFANPVFDKDLFVGREHELEEIRYYLNHAKTAPRPINIAILGPRTSGKTSLLNMCQLEARNKEFCTVRIDLDENDAKTQLGFFYKLFDGLLSEACELGAFGCKDGKTYDVYLDITNTYIIPEDKTFCPFLFPLQYAKAMSSGNINAQLSDYNYKNDLIKISSELKHPIIILLDEGDVLAKSRVHLEKLRNIFMNLPGFMLVLSGTPQLFPVIDEVFSPIIRQFKKIRISQFESEKETEDCIRKPLEKIKLKPEEIFDFETYRDVREIHDLSSGRPYEIQLICHTLFKRVQSKRSKKMKLNLSVLEEVRREFETSQDITARPLLQKIKNLNKEQLLALTLLCTCDGLATFDQIWSIEYIIRDEEKWSRKALKKELDFLINDNLIQTKEEIIKFNGDDFDKIYTKYYAREQRISLKFHDLPLAVFWHLNLDSFLKIKELKSLLKVMLSKIDFDVLGIVNEMARISPDKDVFVESPPVIEDLYFLMVDYRNYKKIPIIHVNLVLPWLGVQSLFYLKNPSDTKTIKSCMNKIESLGERTKEIGGKLLVEKINLPVVQIEVLAKKVENTDNEMLRNKLAHFHMLRMFYEYLKKDNIKEALFNVDLAYRYNTDPETSLFNNFGYLSMATGNLNKARSLFEESIKSSKESSLLALSSYNLGIVEAKSAHLDTALEQIDQCIKSLENATEEERRCSCLFIPEIINRKLRFKEVKEPDLLEVAEKAKGILESFLNLKP